MFISTTLKEQIASSIHVLEERTRDLTAEVLYLKGKLKATEANILVLRETIEQNKPKPKKQSTAAQRAKQREYMRKYKARKKAEKAAQLAQVVVA